MKNGILEIRGAAVYLLVTDEKKKERILGRRIKHHARSVVWDATAPVNTRVCVEREQQKKKAYR